MLNKWYRMSLCIHSHIHSRTKSPQSLTCLLVFNTGTIGAARSLGVALSMIPSASSLLNSSVTFDVMRTVLDEPS